MAQIKKSIVKIDDLLNDGDQNVSLLVKLGAVLIYLPIMVWGNLQYEIPGARKSRTVIGGKLMEKCSIGLKSLIFFFDSLLRVLTSMFCCKRNVLTEPSIYTHYKIFIIRTIGALGNVIQSIGMILCGGEIFAVMRQARIPLVAVLRYFTMNDAPTFEETNYLWITMCASLAFVLCKNLGTDDFGLGILLLFIGLVMRTIYYVLTEVFLKNELVRFSVTEKQTLVGVHDLIGYFFVIWLEIWVEQRSWNPFVDFFVNPAMSICVLANFSQNWLGIVITFWLDSMMLQLLNTLGSGFTWLVKLTYKPSEWKVVKIPILFVLMSSVLAYTRLSNKRKHDKKKKFLLLKNI